MAKYSALDDSSRFFYLDNRKLEIFVSFLANSEDGQSDAYLAVIKDFYTKKKSRKVRLKVEGFLLKNFIDKNISEGNSLIACRYFKYFPELKDIVHKYHKKGCRIDGKNVFKKADKMSKSLSKDISLYLESEEYMRKLAESIERKDEKLFINGIELLLYFLPYQLELF